MQRGYQTVIYRCTVVCFSTHQENDDACGQENQHGTGNALQPRQRPREALQDRLVADHDRDQQKPPSVLKEIAATPPSASGSETAGRHAGMRLEHPLEMGLIGEAKVLGYVCEAVSSANPIPGEVDALVELPGVRRHAGDGAKRPDHLIAAYACQDRQLSQGGIGGGTDSSGPVGSAGPGSRGRSALR